MSAPKQFKAVTRFIIQKLMPLKARSPSPDTAKPLLAFHVHPENSLSAADGEILHCKSEIVLYNVPNCVSNVSSIYSVA